MFAVFFEETVFSVPGTDLILVTAVLINMFVLNVVVGNDHADGSAGGEIVFHDAGEDINAVLLFSGGIQRSLTGFALVQFRLNKFRCNLDSCGNTVNDGDEPAVEFLRDIGVFPESAGVGFSAAGDSEKSAESVAEHKRFLSH